jgi:phospholipase/lecithinase/hemolysin
MASTLIRAVWVAVLVAVAPAGKPVSAGDISPAPIDRLVVFGDSLSDPGNAFIATREFEVRPFEPIPDAPYLIGRLHFTNGPTWIEYLARGLGLFRGGRPALLRPGVYTNYAFGGARARLNGPSDLSGQVARFLADFDGVASAETLYVLWIGATDLRDAAEATAVDLNAGLGIIAQAIGATADSIQRLHSAGARSFLVLNLPNLGDAPAVRALGPDAQDDVRELSEGYNFGFDGTPVIGLEATLEGLRNTLADSVILSFDVFAGLEELMADPDLAGLTNLTESCITPGVIIGAICQRPRKYLFWDFIHPTTKAHEYLSEQARATLEMAFFIDQAAF